MKEQIVMTLSRKKWNEKRNQAKTRGIGFSLTLYEYEWLMYDAGITSDDIGRHSHEYCLGRIGDEGSYEIGNCRFITVKQNIIEKCENGGQDTTNKKRREYFNDNLSKYGHKLPPEVRKNMSDQRKGDNKRVLKQIENGNNAFVGACRWKSPQSTKQSHGAWSKSLEFYEYFIEHGSRPIKCAEHHGMVKSKAIQNIFKEFKLGWVPSSDEEFLTWLLTQQSI